MQIGKLAMILAGTAIFLFGFVSALLFHKIPLFGAEVAEGLDVGMDRKLSEEKLGPQIKMNGRSIKGQTLLQVHAENPNRFNLTYSKADFQVTGVIARVSELSALNETNGFFVPLDMEWEPYQKIIESQNLEGQILSSVSLWLLDIDEKKAAGFAKGQRVSVSCKNARIIGDDGLTFDKCTEGRN